MTSVLEMPDNDPAEANSLATLNHTWASSGRRCLFDAEGVVVKVWENVRVKVHAEAVLAEATVHVGSE